MNKTLITISLLASLTTATSCSNPQEKVQAPEEISTEENILYKSDNSATSLDWNGTYRGTVPCARCEGIETTLTLNIDRTYKLSTHYFGLNDALEEVDSGTFIWDETGSFITLEKVSNGPTQYKVGENRLWQLDKESKRITGDLADHYILTKIQ
ncbi:copper resistance protein NlpE [Algoriphagus sp. C2-6-M1]|uniref:copper resistance protein NlpE n=1 Tax=Algoriphagus persicinus TaxID=3108754 RepID=UPI002B37D8A0|nr:copper resistance protein NlpE [Algoriphagus sp. C2-6-M1]MEB2779544.1 copper resistance protein NlpE [Algoriphagus sp. C2-6-M1]